MTPSGRALVCLALSGALAGTGAIADEEQTGEAAPAPAPGEIGLTSAPGPRSGAARTPRLLREKPAEERLRDLPTLLARIDSEDPDLRMRARRSVHRVIHAYLRANTPVGMHLVAPRLVVSRGKVRMEGGFYLGHHEVTVGEFRAHCADAKRALRASRSRPATAPITMVNLDEARAFARRVGARLPTLDELAHAMFAGGRRRFPWGDRFDPRRVNSRETGRGGAEPVLARKAGCSAEGIHGLLGNVAEWTESTRGEGERMRHLVVGGSYRTPALTSRFVTYRMRPRERQSDVGFRLAQSLPPLPDGG